MTGTVHAINRRRGLVAIATDGGFTIIEMLTSDPIHLGDQLQWDDDRLGTATYRNLTKRTSHSVNAHAHGVHESRVRQKLKL
jgi:hypothetical protein